MDGRVQRGQNTRAQLLAAATDLFAERGYEATSIELVLQRSGVSRGSLYHHFTTKEALFEAVLDGVEARVARSGVQAAARFGDPVEALRAGCLNFLELAIEPVVQRIVLLDAPAALGWQRWREIDERHAFGILKRAVGAIHERHALAVAPELVAHMLLASLIELAMLVARADRPKRALRDAREALEVLIDRLLADAV